MKTLQDMIKEWGDKKNATFAIAEKARDDADEAFTIHQALLLREEHLNELKK
jgi:predicted enzyme involved in methoxymalonyl-ACP biosynthesis